MDAAPSLSVADIRATRAAIAPYVVETPVWPWHSPVLARQLPPDTAVYLKLELFQRTGTFKPRGALAVMLSLSPEQRARGVTAVSAGNHAIAVAYAAHTLGTTAHVVMISSANSARIAACREYGAQITLVDGVHDAFARAESIEKEEGRTFVHPFEGPLTARGTATIGLELVEQLPDLDAVIVPVGGGGLAGGISAAVKLLRPQCAVYGVEPTGADSMRRSLADGQPRNIDAVRTIADSLGAPYALPYSFALCQRYLDDVVVVDDNAIIAAMKLQFEEARLATEPAGAAATAALLGPLRERLAGQRVGLIICGSNIDLPTFQSYFKDNEATLG